MLQRHRAFRDESSASTTRRPWADDVGTKTPGIISSDASNEPLSCAVIPSILSRVVNPVITQNVANYLVRSSGVFFLDRCPGNPKSNAAHQTL